MKVIHLSSVHTPDDNRILRMCKAVAKAGHDVGFIVPTSIDTVTEGVRIIAVPPPQTRIERMFRTTRAVYARAVAENSDVYHFHDPELIPVGLALRIYHRRRVIYDVHENVPDQILGKDYIPRIARKAVAAAYEVIERQSARYFSAIVTANEDIDHRFAGVTPRVTAVHNYADAEEFTSKAQWNPWRYRSGNVFHSGASKRTSFPIVVRATELLRDVAPLKIQATTNVHDDEPYIRNAAEHSSVRARFDVLGMVPRESFTALLSNCAISLVLYADPRNHLSIRSNRFYESLAACAPVITSDFPEWKKLVESLGCGIAVDPNDARAVADAIRFLLAHPDQAAEMGRRGHAAFLQQFSWQSESSRLLGLYEDLLSANVGRGSLCTAP